MFYKNGGKIKVSLWIGYVTVQEDLLWIISVGRQRRDQEKGIGLKNPNVKYKDLHTMTTGSQVREWSMKHSIICCYWWSITFTSCLHRQNRVHFKVRDSEATKKGGGKGKLPEMVRIIKTLFMVMIRTTMHDSLVQLFGLCHFRSCSTVTMFNGGCSWPSIKILLQYSVQCHQVQVGSCCRSYMGTVYNCNKIWYVLIFCSGPHGVHGYSQQYIAGIDM